MNENRSLLWRLNVILYAILFLTISLYLYSHRIMSSGFFYDRLGELITNFNNGSDIIQGYESFPFAPSLLSVISNLTGLELVDVVCLPIIQITSFCSLIIFSKLFFDSKHALVISTAVFLYLFALNPHFEEYLTAQVMFFFFLYSIYITLTEGKNRTIFASMSILFYFATKFYGPPIEMWALSFLSSFTLLALIRHKLYKEDCFKFKNNLHLNLLILSIVIFFAYNPKFYDQLLLREIGPTVFMDTVSSLINSLLHSSIEVTQEYEYILETPTPLRITNIFYHIILFVPFGIVIFNSVLKKNVFSEARDLNYLLFLALSIPFFADFILYASVGLFITRYAILVYPFISLYFLKKRSQSLFSIISILLLIVGCVHFIFVANFDFGYKISNEDASSSISSYLGSKTDVNTYILTDHRTYGLLRTYFGLLFNNPDYFVLQEYNVERYKSIFGLSKIQLLDFDYLVVSTINLDYPIQVGPPLWTYFEPLHERYSLLSNNRLSKIYQSGDFEVYLPITPIK